MILVILKLRRAQLILIKYTVVLGTVKPKYPVSFILGQAILGHSSTKSLYSLEICCYI